MQPEATPAFFSGMMAVMVVIYVGVIVGWLVFLVAMWKLMRAHERIADILRGIAQALHPPTPGQG